jgi:hypothetical protein
VKKREKILRENCQGREILGEKNILKRRNEKKIKEEEEKIIKNYILS